MSEMLLASTATPSDSAIRQRILRYLEATEYSEALEAILSQSDAGLTKTKEIVEAIRSPNEATELRGQVARYLESYPDHPGLLMLRSLAEAFSRDKNATIVQQNFSASISSASENYSVDEAELFNFIVWSITKVADRNLILAMELQADMLRQYQNRRFARILIEQSPIELASTPAWFLLDNLTKRSKEVLSI